MLPTGIPPTWAADVAADAQVFSVTYRARDTGQSVSLATVVANPPPPNDNSRQTNPRFHGDQRSLYQVQFPDQPGSYRFLMWVQPATAPVFKEYGGVPYLLSARGITEDYFWGIARSLSRSSIEVFGEAPATALVKGPKTIRTNEGLILPLPSGWYSREEKTSWGSYWDLMDHNPDRTKADGLGITVLTSLATAESREQFGECPRHGYEMRADYCGFVHFGGRRWFHVIGETDVPITEFSTMATNGSYALIGFYPRGNFRARKAVESVMRRARLALGPQCGTNKLSLRIAPPVSEATGQNTGIFLLRNNSPSRCWLLGYPEVQLLDRKGVALAFQYQHTGDQMVTNARPKPVSLPPGGYAYFAINKYRCDLGGKANAVKIRIAPPGTSYRLSLNLPEYPVLIYCGPHDPGDLVSVSPVEATEKDVRSR